MNNTTTIDVPRLDGETDRAYAARVEYVTMGPQRSIEKLIAQKGIKKGSHVREWSRTYGWVESARKYDEAVAFITIQEAAQQYRVDLEEHRARYQRTGKALHGVAGKMLERLNAQLPHMELNATTLATITKAMQVAADLEAHALRIGDLLPKLSDDVHD